MAEGTGVDVGVRVGLDIGVDVVVGVGMSIEDGVVKGRGVGVASVRAQAPSSRITGAKSIGQRKAFTID